MSCRVYILLLLVPLDTLQVACDRNCTRLFHYRMLYSTYVFTSFLLEVKNCLICLFLKSFWLSMDKSLSFHYVMFEPFHSTLFLCWFFSGEYIYYTIKRQNLLLSESTIYTLINYPGYLFLAGNLETNHILNTFV